MKNKVLFAAAVLTLLSVFSSCGSSGSPLRELTLRVVHSPEIKEYMLGIKGAFEKNAPKIPGYQSVRVDLIEEEAITAAKKIASGEIKTEAWISSSTSLVNFTNDRLVNLGARQIDCQLLFGSPVVLATQTRFLGEFNEKSRNFSWREFFGKIRAEALKRGTFEAHVSYGVPISGRTIAGLPVLLQLTYLSAAGQEGNLTLDILKGQPFEKNFKDYMGAVSRFYAQDRALLEKASNPTSNRLLFALTTEQQLISFNRMRTREQGPLVALYPSEGSFWQDYSICLSDADWVTAPQRAAVRLFSEFMAGDGSKRGIAAAGYRPAGWDFATAVEPLTEANGVFTGATRGSRLPVSSDVLEYISNGWQSFMRPASYTVVIDVSGTTEGATLSSEKKFARNVFASMRDGDLGSLIVFSDKPEVLASYSSDKAELIRLVDGLESGGGSAIYQAVSRAVGVSTGDRVSALRKNIFVLTDGKDNKSTASLPEIVDLLKDKKRYYDINLQVLAFQSQGVDYSDLQDIAKSAEGEFRQTTSFDIDAIIADYARTGW